MLKFFTIEMLNFIYQVSLNKQNKKEHNFVFKNLFLIYINQMFIFDNQSAILEEKIDVLFYLNN
jgi:hypothetical protein